MLTSSKAINVNGPPREQPVSVCLCVPDYRKFEDCGKSGLYKNNRAKLLQRSLEISLEMAVFPGKRTAHSWARHCTLMAKARPQNPARMGLHAGRHR
jgi:hypothetical protein